MRCTFLLKAFTACKTALLVMLICIPALATAQNNSGAARKSIEAVRITRAPVIDGVLDDDVWALAKPITDFHQTRPGDQTPTSEDTEVRILYTEDAIYIAARMDDSEPDLIATPTLRHGQGLGPDDRLVIILDPFNTRRTGYRFETNLNGVRHDALYTTVNNFNADWSTIWDVKTSLYENGWIAEIEIPFKSLPMDPNTEEWGFNFGRGIRRRNEEMAWVSFNRGFNPSIAGTLTGMRDMSQGVGLDIVPSLAVVQQKNHVSGDSNNQINPSLDAFYRITPSLNAALTINTDFSAVNVDSRQVNLDRFNLFFPEQRNFFLNDADCSSLAISVIPATRLPAMVRNKMHVPISHVKLDWAPVVHQSTLNMVAASVVASDAGILALWQYSRVLMVRLIPAVCLSAVFPPTCWRNPMSALSLLMAIPLPISTT